MAEKEKQQDIEIRRLQNNDIFRIAKMLLKVSGDAQDEITTLVQDNLANRPDKKAENLTDKEKAERNKQDLQTGLQLARIVLEKCLTHAEQDLMEWFGDLCGMSAKEFGEASPELTLDIIEQLVEEDLKNFFSRAFRLFSKMRRSAS